MVILGFAGDEGVTTRPRRLMRLGSEVSGGGFRAATDVELLEDVHEVRADGAGADVEARGDFFVGKTFGDESKDFTFAGGKTLRR